MRQNRQELRSHSQTKLICPKGNTPGQRRWSGTIAADRRHDRSVVRIGLGRRSCQRNPSREPTHAVTRPGRRHDPNVRRRADRAGTGHQRLRERHGYAGCEPPGGRCHRFAQRVGQADDRTDAEAHADTPPDPYRYTGTRADSRASQGRRHGFRIGSPYRLRTLEPAIAARLDPILDGFTQAYREYFSIGVREIRRSGAFEDVLLVFRIKSGVATSVIGSWDDLIRGATMGGTLKATTKTVSGVKVTYVSTNTFGLAIFRLSGNRTYRNYVFEIVAPDQAKLAAATAAFLKANN
jgi:hypothetical protein